ncbi:MAG: lipid-binding SYLF domain-containing protein [Blastocatellia bacterium]
MKSYLKQGVLSLCLATGLLATAQAQMGRISVEISQSQKAAQVFNEIMGAPDSKIPEALFEKAACIAVFPNVIKAGFIVGGRGGRGVASCRTARGWSAPVYLNLGGGSFGLQIGAQATDFVFLMMNREGVDSLLSGKFTLGGDASVAAGPVGREAGASTDLKLDAQILSYSRSKGLFAGLELKGVVIKPDTDEMRNVYGAGVSAKQVLAGKATAPESGMAFSNTLGKHVAPKAEN